MALRTSQPHSESAALTVYDLWKSYGERIVVQGVNFTLNPGEILGLLGPNGAGKTTTVGMLYGAVVPSRGSVQLGKNQIQTQGRFARASMGIVTQEDNLDPDQGTPNELIERTVGREVVEISGISEPTLQQLAERAGTWYRPFGSSYLIGLPIDNPQPLWEKLSATSPDRLTRRRTNLEDVFLRLTGNSPKNIRKCGSPASSDQGGNTTRQF